MEISTNHRKQRENRTENKLIGSKAARAVVFSRSSRVSSHIATISIFVMLSAGGIDALRKPQKNVACGDLVLELAEQKGRRLVFESA